MSSYERITTSALSGMPSHVRVKLGEFDDLTEAIEPFAARFFGTNEQGDPDARVFCSLLVRLSEDMRAICAEWGCVLPAVERNYGTQNRYDVAMIELAACYHDPTVEHDWVFVEADVGSLSDPRQVDMWMCGGCGCEMVVPVGQTPPRKGE